MRRRRAAIASTIATTATAAVAATTTGLATVTTTATTVTAVAAVTMRGACVRRALPTRLLAAGPTAPPRGSRDRDADRRRDDDDRGRRSDEDRPARRGDRSRYCAVRAPLSALGLTLSHSAATPMTTKRAIAAVTATTMTGGRGGEPTRWTAETSRPC
jgi:hypothetical protein